MADCHQPWNLGRQMRLYVGLIQSGNSGESLSSYGFLVLLLWEACFISWVSTGNLWWRVGRRAGMAVKRELESSCNITISARSGFMLWIPYYLDQIRFCVFLYSSHVSFIHLHFLLLFSSSCFPLAWWSGRWLHFVVLIVISFVGLFSAVIVLSLEL